MLWSFHLALWPWAFPPEISGPIPLELGWWPWPLSWGCGCHLSKPLGDGILRCIECTYGCTRLLIFTGDLFSFRMPEQVSLDLQAHYGALVRNLHVLIWNVDLGDALWITWFGLRGMRWDTLLPTVWHQMWDHQPPFTLVTQLGENDMEAHMGIGLAHQAEADL